MNFLKFVNFFYRIKSNFSYLPIDIQQELVDVMENYYVKCIILRYSKERKN